MNGGSPCTAPLGVTSLPLATLSCRLQHFGTHLCHQPRLLLLIQACAVDGSVDAVNKAGTGALGCAAAARRPRWCRVGAWRSGRLHGGAQQRPFYSSCCRWRERGPHSSRL